MFHQCLSDALEPSCVHDLMLIVLTFVEPLRIIQDTHVVDVGYAYYDTAPPGVQDRR